MHKCDRIAKMSIESAFRNIRRTSDALNVFTDSDLLKKMMQLASEIVTRPDIRLETAKEFIACFGAVLIKVDDDPERHTEILGVVMALDKCIHPILTAEAIDSVSRTKAGLVDEKVAPNIKLIADAMVTNKFSIYGARVRGAKTLSDYLAHAQRQTKIGRSHVHALVKRQYIPR
jgi:hypothetical protein